MPSDLRLPTISLMIPAYNEAAHLPRLWDTIDVARNQYRHRAAQFEVIVADNDSTDETAGIAAARGCRVAHVPKRLIAAARNGGAAEARGEIVFFADVDFQFHPETFNYIDDVIQHPRIHRRGDRPHHGAVVAGHCGDMVYDHAAALALRV